MDLRRAHHVRLRQREVDLVAAVRAAHLNLRGAGVLEREQVTKLARRYGLACRGGQRAGIGERAGGGCGSSLRLDVVRGAKDERGANKQHHGARDRERLSLARSPVAIAADEAAGGLHEPLHGDLEDARQTAQRVVALPRLAPSQPRIGARVEDHGEHFLLGQREIGKMQAQH